MGAVLSDHEALVDRHIVWDALSDHSIGDHDIPRE